MSALHVFVFHLMIDLMYSVASKFKSKKDDVKSNTEKERQEAINYDFYSLKSKVITTLFTWKFNRLCLLLFTTIVRIITHVVTIVCSFLHWQKDSKSPL